ncbi:VOC family protein [Ekhidna sp.]
MNNLRPFHLAVPVKELDQTRSFYRDIMGLEEGRSSDCWVDFNLYGHQFVIHMVENKRDAETNPVDGKAVPVPHFGVVLSRSDWDDLAEKLKDAGIEFIIEPYVRFEDEVGEQATMFFMDPSGNALEFKSFKDDAQIFAK